MKKRWIAMFSQSGSEIAALAKHLGKWPDVIITNNTDRNKWCKPLLELELRQKGKAYGGGTSIQVVSSIQARTANFLHGINNAKDALITLHGWLRIIPKEICEQYEIVNGHPGLINVHPELKGKDPQIRAYEAGHATIGSVVHKVTPVVDDGEILEWTATYQDEDDVWADVLAKFQHTSFSSWVKFFDKQ
jgi:folate-dependent phosphoribosylglycinamide formyltransferase PurN